MTHRIHRRTRPLGLLAAVSIALALVACSSDSAAVVSDGTQPDEANAVSAAHDHDHAAGQEHDHAHEHGDAHDHEHGDDGHDHAVAHARPARGPIPKADPPPPVDVIGIQDAIGIQWAGKIFHKDRMRWKAPDPVEDYYILVIRELTPHHADLGLEPGKAYRYRGLNEYEYIRDVDLALDNDEIAALFGTDDDKPVDVMLDAIEQDDGAVARKLLADGLSANATNRSERPFLLVAAHAGALEVVRALVEAGCDLDVTDVAGENALHQASKGGDAEVVSYLVQRGLDVESKDHLGHTPVFFAAESNSPEVVRVLVDAGADVKLKDNRGYTPLSYAKVFLRSRMKPELRELLTPK